MLRKTGLFILVALLAAPILYAGEAGQDKPAYASTKAGTTEVIGTIDQIDLQAKAISVKVQAKDKAEPETKVFAFDDKTSFLKKSEAAMKAEDLKVGDTVSLEVDSSNLLMKVQLRTTGTAATGYQEEQN